MKPYRLPSPLPLILLLLGILLFGLFSCNTVKKSTDTKISKTDSSSQVKTDSTVHFKTAIRVDSTTLKTWDKETVIEYEKAEYLKPNIDSGNYIEQVIGYEDGAVKVFGKIKKITIREKGKDSSNLKKSDNSEQKTNWTKNVQTDLSKFDKSKKVNKESKRFPVGFIIGIVLAGLIVLAYIIYKVKP